MILLLERVVEVIKLGSFVWTGVVTWLVVCQNSIFGVSFRSALSFRLCKNLWFRVLFVLLVALLFNFLQVVMPLILLQNLP